MTRSEQINTINSAFAELGRLDLQNGFIDVRDHLHQMNRASEKQHRLRVPQGIAHGLSASISAKLFTVKHLLDGFNNPRWTIDDILSIRTEALYAQAYATKHHAELAVWAEKWTEAFKQVDYAELQKVAA